MRAHHLAALALVSLPAAADWSATVTSASEYQLTGISISARRPVGQASLDYWHAPETGPGHYAGVWASDGVDFGGCCGESHEVDIYAGVTLPFVAATTLDLSLNDYRYPGSRGLGFTELGVELRHDAGWSLRYNGSDDYLNTGEYGQYVEARWDGALPADFAWFVHAGQTNGPAFTPARVGIPDYVDRAAGVARDLGPLRVELSWVETNLDGTYRRERGVLANQGRWLLTLATRIALD